jgi:hypothetical protein
MNYFGGKCVYKQCFCAQLWMLKKVYCAEKLNKNFTKIAVKICELSAVFVALWQ